MQSRGKTDFQAAMKNLEQLAQFEQASAIAADVSLIIQGVLGMTEHEKLQFVLAHQESVVEHQCGRKPTGRPVLMWPNGKIRIEFLGTFSSVSDAYDRVAGLLLKASKDHFE